MKRFKLLSALPLIFGVPLAAHAATMDVFTFQLSGFPGTGTATIAASPTPSSSVAGTSFTLSNVSASYDGATYTAPVTFLNSGGAGSEGVVFGGDALFSGTDAAPTFNLGTFTLTGDADLGNGPQLVTASVMITQATTVPTAATPEPESLVLAGTGALGLAGLLRRRFV